MSAILPLPASKPRESHIRAVALSKAYRKGTGTVPVLRGVDVSVGRGEFVTIIGQSGSGKSTLLHVMGLLDTPENGEVRLDGHRIDDLPLTTRDELRNRVFGFVFQFYHLLPELTLLENVLSPLMIRYPVWTYLEAAAGVPGLGEGDPPAGRPGAPDEPPAVGALRGKCSGPRSPGP